MIDWASNRLFSWMHGHHLVYNACWEDPRLDREALCLTPRDSILMITSAGCNALDYALDAPASIHCVDLNPRQNALLELKRAAIRTLEFDTFFDLFGRGRLEHFADVYRSRLRKELPPEYRGYWDERPQYFTGSPVWPSFYFRGTSGFFARLLGWYIDARKARGQLGELFAAADLHEQRRRYAPVRELLWTRLVRGMLGWDGTLSLLGIPRPQREQVEHGQDGGIVRFIEECLDTVFTRLPLGDNYFWWLYLNGQYSPERCPEYLKEANFLRLKGGLAERIQTHTDSVLGFLEGFEGRLTRFVLLDHMDWLSTTRRDWLEAEWQAIVDHAAPQARLIWRSGGLHCAYVDPLRVRVDGRQLRVGDLLTYRRELAARLHARDRVHTYGSFHIADLASA